MMDRHSMEFIDGVHEFIKVSENHKYGGFVRCPCKNLFSSGFMPNYYFWTKHGERGIMLDNNEEEDDRIPDFVGNYGAFFVTLQWVSLKKMLKDTM